MLTKEELAELRARNESLPEWDDSMGLLWARRDGKWSTGLGVLTKDDAELAVSLRKNLLAVCDHIDEQSALIGKLVKALTDIANEPDGSGEYSNEYEEHLGCDACREKTLIAERVLYEVRGKLNG